LVRQSATYAYQAECPVFLSDYGLDVSGERAMPNALLQPEFLSQPRGQTNYVGTSITLSADAIGTLPIAYQWRMGEVEIVGATNSSLFIPISQLTNSGNYQVVVYTGNGAITSTVAHLRIITRLE